MAVDRIVDYFRDAKTGLGIPGRTVSLRRQSDNVEIATASTDGAGRFVFTSDDVGYVGPVYYVVDDGSGTYKRHSGASFGQIGAVWFDSLQRAVGALGIGTMNGLEVTADGSGMKVTVSPGVAISADGIPFVLEAPVDVTLVAADGSNPRIDLIVLRLSREGQVSEGAFSLQRTTGSPASSPAVPAKTTSSATWDIVLAHVLVDAGASVISSGKVTDRRKTEPGQEILSLPLHGSVISAGTVTATQLASGSVETAKIVDSAVTTAKINDGAVTDGKVATGINATKIGAGSVSNTEFGYLDGVTSGIQSQLDGKAAAGSYASTTHTHTQPATLMGKAFNAYTNLITVNTGSTNICDFNLGPLVSGVTYDVIADGSGQANAASGGNIMGQMRIEAGDTPVNGYATATVGGERHIGASHNKTIVGSGSSINISFRAISSNNGASVSGAGCWAMAIPRNVPAS